MDDGVTGGVRTLRGVCEASEGLAVNSRTDAVMQMEEDEQSIM